MRTTGALVLAASFATSIASAEVSFKTETLTVPADDGVVTLTIEVADTPARRSRGYMGRTDIGPRDGMLFVFEPPRNVSMWMKNTPTSLDMIFLEADGSIESIAERTTPGSTAIVSSAGEVAYVLEVLAGSAERWGLEPGDVLESGRFDGPTDPDG